ncbi:MAG: enoyl-CoA hydratase/isomerase family protein [Saprospiraceae bacterium]|nr:enoyl-CoA hydratase/isomerase family protein [Saprospiraceae bacterium]
MHIKVERKNEFAILFLDRPKVNALNHDMIKEMRVVVAQLQKDDSVRGVIIGGRPNYFSAGLDLIELSGYDLEGITAFWQDFIGMMVDLIKFPKPTIAAIGGYSPAGGAVIAVTCDYRFMTEGDHYHIGLNEVSVGISINEPIFRSYSFWLGEQKAYHAMMEGKLFSPKEALAVGLVDALFPQEELLERAEEKMKQLLRADDHTLQNTKMALRSAWIRVISQDMEADIAARSARWMEPESQRRIAQILGSLKRSK